MKVNKSCHTYERVVSHIWKNHFTRTNESFHTFKCVSIGWRRLIECLWLQVIFHKRATRYRALLRKMSSKDTASYGCLRHPVLNVDKFLCLGDGWALSHMNGDFAYQTVMTHELWWVMSHIWVYLSSKRWRMSALGWRVSPVTHMNESCHTIERVMSNIWVLSHFEWVISHVRMSHGTHVNRVI